MARAVEQVDGRSRAVFFGSGAFAVPVLDTLASLGEVELVLVVTAPDRPAGRRGALTPTPVAARARALGLPLFQPERLRAPEAIERLAGLTPDVGVLADYGQLVPPAVLGLFPRRILNLHPSLLPRHRGAAPVAATILAGDRETGVSLMLLVPELDAGPVVAVERLPVGPAVTAPELEARLAALAAGLLTRSLAPWLRGELAAVEQAREGVSVTRPLGRADGRLDPARSAEELERQVRAYQPWPGAWIQTAEGRLLVRRAACVAGGPRERGAAAGGPAGALVADGDGLALVTAGGRLRLLEVQLAGGRSMSAPELRRGHPRLLGTGG